MELEEIVSRLEFLESERRSEKTALDKLSKSVSELDGVISGLRTEVKELSSQVAQLSSVTDRFAQVDEGLSKIRIDFNRAIEKSEKQSIDREQEVEKLRSADLDAIQKALAESKKGISVIQSFRKELKNRADEEYRLSRSIEETQMKLADTLKQNEEIRQSLTLLEATQRQESKMTADALGELSAMRKRTDELRGKNDFLAESIRKLDTRFNDYRAEESERKQSLLGLVEKQNIQQVERDRTWKEWQTRFTTIDEEAKKFEKELQSLDITLKSLKKSQSTFEEVNQKFDRKINELTEMQRLSDEKFRQEWLGFKAEDQKRWTNYTISQEEMLHETNRQVENMVDRLAKLEDATQELQDALTSFSTDSQQKLQKIMDTASDWIDSHKRILGLKK